MRRTVINCSSYTFKLSYFVTLVKCSHKLLNNKENKKVINRDIGISCSKFSYQIHHSGGTPTPLGAPAAYTWGVAEGDFRSDTYSIRTILLSHCIHYVYIIGDSFSLYSHSLPSTTPTSSGATAGHSPLLSRRSPPGARPKSACALSSFARPCLRLLSSVTRLHLKVADRSPFALAYARVRRSIGTVSVAKWGRPLSSPLPQRHCRTHPLSLPRQFTPYPSPNISYAPAK